MLSMIKCKKKMKKIKHGKRLKKRHTVFAAGKKKGG